MMNLGCVNIVYKRFSNKTAQKEKKRIKFENNGCSKKYNKQKSCFSFRVKGFF